MKDSVLVPELPSATVALATETVGDVTTAAVCPAAVMAFCHLAMVLASSAAILPVLIEASLTPDNV